MEVYVSQCVVYKSAYKTLMSEQVPCIPLELSEGSWQKIGIECIGPMNSLTHEMSFATMLTER